MVILQKKVGNQWVDIADISELIDGDIYRQSVGGHVNPQGDLVGNGWEQKTYITPPPAGVPVKIINMTAFGELLPDLVLLEIEDFKLDTTAPSGKRQIATRLLARIYGGVKVDVLDGKIENLLSGLVAHTSLTTEQANDILATLSA